MKNLKKKNDALNKRNEKRNKAYDNAANVARATKSGEYVTNRDQIINLDVDDETKKVLEREFKAFYRDKKLNIWDANLGSQPDYGSFKPSYYGKTYQDVRNKYKEYEDNDDIDVTEGYGRNNYYHWHYTTYGKNEKRRGNEAEKVTEIERYKDAYERNPEVVLDDQGVPLDWAEQTDADLQFIRDRQLNVGDDTTTRVLRIPEIKALQEEAIRAREEGVGEGEEENRFIQLGKEYYLDIEDDDQFVALFRLSEDPRDRDISMRYNVENGITQGIY